MQPDNFPEQFYLLAAEDNQFNVYRIDTDLSQILIHAYRGGMMTLLDYEHLIASQDVQGYLLIDKNAQQCQIDIFVPLATLNVDDPQLRAEAKLSTGSSQNTIVNTKKQLLKTLEANNYPFIQLQSSDCASVFSGKETKVQLTLHGVTQERLVKIELQPHQDDLLIASGKFSILQTDFTIEPFSVFNGLIKVEDKLDLTYKLVFNRID